MLLLIYPIIIAMYVVCPNCKSIETTLVRDPNNKLYFLECGKCSSRVSVATIRSGYHAISRADRKKARA